MDGRTNKRVWWALGAVALIAVSLLGAYLARNIIVPQEAEGDAGIANPASVYCGTQGGTLEIRTDAEGGQIGYCVFEDGSECEEWALWRGDCAPDGVEAAPAADAQGVEPGTEDDAVAVPSHSEFETPTPTPDGEPVEGWVGTLQSNPPGAEFDDAFAAGDGQLYGIGGIDETINAELDALRDTGEPFAVWGVLLQPATDVNGVHIRVERIERDPAVDGG